MERSRPGFATKGPLGMGVALMLMTAACEAPSAPATGDDSEPGADATADRPGGGQGLQAEEGSGAFFLATVEPEGDTRVRGVAQFEMGEDELEVRARVTGLEAGERIPQHVHLEPTCDPPGGILLNLDDDLTVGGEGPPAGPAYPKANRAGVVRYDAARPLDDLAEALDEHLGLGLEDLRLGERNVNFHEPLPAPIPSQGCGTIDRIR